MKRVYVSYAFKDEALVSQVIIPALEAQGLECWHSGKVAADNEAEWQSAFQRIIASCDACLGVISESSAGSHWVQAELHLALAQGNDRVTLVRVAPTVSPEMDRICARCHQIELYPDQAAGLERLRRWAAAIEARQAAEGGQTRAVERISSAATRTEVLRHLTQEAGRLIGRAVLFVINGRQAVGREASDDSRRAAIRQVVCPLDADPELRELLASRQIRCGGKTDSAVRALAALGEPGRTIASTPIVVSERATAILWCDTPRHQIPLDELNRLETLVRCAENAATAAGAFGPGPSGVAEGRENRLRPSLHDDAAASHESASRDRVPAAAGRASERPATAGALQQPAPAAPENPKAHSDARRLARLIVSEIKLYNEQQVAEGRRQRDLYARLRDDIERGRAYYSERVPEPVRSQTSYYLEEVVRVLADGDAAVLGPMATSPDLGRGV